MNTGQILIPKNLVKCRSRRRLKKINQEEYNVIINFESNE